MPAPRSDHGHRVQLDRLLSELHPLDAQERANADEARAWLRRGAPLWRGRPGGPSPHLVAYAVVVDPDLGAVHLGQNRRARRWMPAGGHVKPRERPEAAAERKLDEELGLRLPLLEGLSSNPLFLTITDTVADHTHQDICLWFVFATSFTTGIGPNDEHVERTRWWTFDEIRTVHPAQLHPAVVRFIAKLEPELG